MTDRDGQHHSQYDPGSPDLIFAHAADVVRATGFAAEHIVVIGGLVPSLLVPVLDPGLEPHVGTTDIDLCLSMALVDGDTGTYERIENVLKNLGFTEGEMSFQWSRTSGVPLTVEFFCGAAPDRPAGRMWRPKAADNPLGKQNLGGRLSALSLDAGRILTEDAETITREVRLPDDKGRLTVMMQVTGPVGFLVAKVKALQSRDKPKDAYDIVWLIESWPGGPRAAARDFAARPAFAFPEVGAALSDLARLFDRTDAVGPRSYARFVSTAGGDQALHERRAHGAISEFIAALGG